MGGEASLQSIFNALTTIFPKLLLIFGKGKEKIKNSVFG